MKQTTKKMVWLVVCLGVGTTGLCTEPFAVGPYLGQTPPGSTPQIFAPGLICQAEVSDSLPTARSFVIAGAPMCTLRRTRIRVGARLRR